MNYSGGGDPDILETMTLAIYFDFCCDILKAKLWSKHYFNILNSDLPNERWLL